MGTTSRAGNEYVLLVKETKDVARILANLGLPFGVPTSVTTSEDNFGQKS